jgi:predicted metal-dependent phosphoesterase TrpH
VSLLVVLSSAFRVLPIRDARTFEGVPEAHIVLSPAYVLLAPLSNVLDTLTLLSKSQHIALVAGVLVLFVLWRVVAAVARRTTARGHVVSTLVFLVAVVLVYAATAFLPRPMAALATDNADLLIVDFHSHTDASHDGVSGWTIQDTRDWHAAAGFDVAYVTDHATVAAAETGMATNPVPAAEGVTLLQGIETGWNGEHVGVLGAERMYKGILMADLKNVDPDALELASLIRGREPIIVWHHPRELVAARLPVASDTLGAGLRAIELVNGDPSSLDRMRRDRAAIIAYADRHNLALTSGTDNHGYGRTAPNWTLMHLRGWRGAAGDELEAAIEQSLREGRYGITRVVERTVEDPGAQTWRTALSVALVPWRMFTTLSMDERVSWLAWTWGAAALGWWVRRRRRPAVA